MKKIYFAFLVFLFAGKISAQAYFPLLDSANTWVYTGSLMGVRLANPNIASNPCSYPLYATGWPNTTYEHTAGDIIINAVTYKTMIGINPSNCYLGAVREDTAARKVFFLDNLGNPEILLYDFSMQVGDTLSINFISTPGYFNSGVYTLDSIRPIHIKAGWRRIFYLNNHLNGGHTLPWIESVGNQAHFIYPYWRNGDLGNLFSTCPGFPHDVDQILTCFHHNNMIYYDSCALYLAQTGSTCLGYADSCDYGNTCTGILSNTESANVSVFPNPSNGKFKIAFDVQCENKFDIVVRDISGKQIVQEVSLGILNEGKNETGIDLSGLPAGTYLLEIKSPESSAYSQIIIK